MTSSQLEHLEISNGRLCEERMQEERAEFIAFLSSKHSHSGMPWLQVCPLHHLAIVNNQCLGPLDSLGCSCKGEPLLLAALHGIIEPGGHMMPMNLWPKISV